MRYNLYSEAGHYDSVYKSHVGLTRHLKPVGREQAGVIPCRTMPHAIYRRQVDNKLSFLVGL